MSSEKVDISVIGGGPGGYAAAIRASKLGLKAAVVEEDKVGGVCLNYGCVPTKSLYHAASLIEEIKRAETFGIKASAPELDFKKAMAVKEQIIDVQRKGVGAYFKKNDIKFIEGKGEILEKGKILVKGPDGNETEIETKNIIIATGSSAANVEPFDISEDGIMDNKDILSLEKLPEPLLIIGGGVVGSEFANIFSSFGSKVTIVEILPEILSTEDEDVSKLIHNTFKKKGIDIFTDTKVENLRKAEGKFKCTVSGGKEISAEKILISVGRRPNSKGMGLEKAGVEVDEKGYIKVDSHLETNVSGIYAIGDVIGGLQLAHVASKEGKIAAGNIAGEEEEMEHDAIPRAIFTSPEIGTVGLNERQAKERNIEVCTGIFTFSHNSKACIEGETEGFMKIVTRAGTGEILGSQVVGPGASDLMHEVVVAMNGELLVDDIASTVHAHPTLSEIVMEAAEDCSGIATLK
ncbi:MAG: dihydrolipoyl dehydrogenase [Actinomycetota bacterium]|nr:dihydrolipoyl dehydrogenase [Actinomycetota bacterium]